VHMVNPGSEWHQWEQRIHAPGTVLTNQFGAHDLKTFSQSIRGQNKSSAKSYAKGERSENLCDPA